MKGEYTEKVETNKNIIKHRNFITTDGEIVELADKCLDDLSMDIVNFYEQQEEKKDISRMLAERNKFKQKILEHCGRFYFDFYNRFNKQEYNYAFRFIYLCTFMNYDNYIVDDKKKLLKASNLKDIFYNISKREFYNTKKYFIDNNLIFIDENKYIKINEKYCKRGNILKKKNIEVVRMFDNAIREIYAQCTPREHKKVGLLIKLLPYINLKYNIVCKNPSEENIEKLDRFKTIKELSKLLGYDESNSGRLSKDLLKLRVNGEKVIMFVITDGLKTIYVNPRVFYKGTRIEELNHLIEIFDENSDKVTINIRDEYLARTTNNNKGNSQK